MQGSSEFIQRSSCRIHPWTLREVHVSAGSLWGMLPFKTMKYEWVSKLLEPYKTSGFLNEINQFGLVGGAPISRHTHIITPTFQFSQLQVTHLGIIVVAAGIVVLCQPSQVWGEGFYTLGPAFNHDMFDFLHTIVFFGDAPPVIHEKHPNQNKKRDLKKKYIAFFRTKSGFAPLHFARYNKLYKKILRIFRIPSTVLQFLTLHGFFHGLALAQGWLSARIGPRGPSISEIPVEPGHRKICTWSVQQMVNWVSKKTCYIPIKLYWLFNRGDLYNGWKIIPI